MAKLSSSKRNKMADSTFAIPSKRAYPINDVSHARNALPGRAARHPRREKAGQGGGQAQVPERREEMSRLWG